ncbi:MAG: hypothetical protein LBG78_10120 [Azoarcus sp.]|jgi:hypothetical protein|nr:hypothetical protein [Azoarcus sp.]
MNFYTAIHILLLSWVGVFVATILICRQMFTETESNGEPMSVFGKVFAFIGILFSLLFADTVVMVLVIGSHIMPTFIGWR